MPVQRPVASDGYPPEEGFVPEIRHQLTVSAPPEKLYPLFSSAEGLRRWWAADCRNIVDRAPAVQLSFLGSDTACRLRPHTFIAPLQAIWEYETGRELAGTQLTFVSSRKPEGTLLRFSHGGWKAETDFFVSCNTVWGELLFRLKDAAEGRPVGPLFTPDGLAV
jgi:uncharacterized protein YndB with AHSA1/START domain